MRKKVSKQPKVGDSRIVNRFLFFPKTIGDEKRWLERTDIMQEYKEIYREIQDDFGCFHVYPYPDYKWVNIAFVPHNVKAGR